MSTNYFVLLAVAILLTAGIAWSFKKQFWD